MHFIGSLLHEPAHAVPAPAQAVRPPTGWPDETVEQAPGVAPPQVWHWPSHLLSQQTPSTQKVLAHSPPALHEVPPVLSGVRSAGGKRSITVAPSELPPSLGDPDISAATGGVWPFRQQLSLGASQK